MPAAALEGDVRRAGGTLPGHARPGGPLIAAKGWIHCGGVNEHAARRTGRDERIRAGTIAATAIDTAAHTETTEWKPEPADITRRPATIREGQPPPRRRASRRAAGQGVGSTRQEKTLHDDPPVTRNHTPVDRSGRTPGHERQRTPRGSVHPSTYVARQTTTAARGTSIQYASTKQSLSSHSRRPILGATQRSAIQC